MLSLNIHAIPAITILAPVDERCVACGQITRQDLFLVPGDPGECRRTFEYAKCQECGTASIHQPIDDFASFYNDTYYSFQIQRLPRWRKVSKAVRDRFSLFGASFITPVLDRWISNPRLEAIRPLFDGTLPRRFRLDDSILDVGCGDGIRLREMRNLHFTNLVGVDPFMRAPEKTDGLELKRCELKDEDRRFALVMLNHSLEHMFDPDAVMEKLHFVLEKGGVLLIRIPLIDTWAWKQYGGEWVGFDPPRHLHLFSRDGFERLASRTGWDIVYYKYDSTAFLFYGTALRLRGIHYGDVKSFSGAGFSKKDARDFARRARELNRQALGDQAAFFLRPKNADET